MKEYLQPTGFEHLNGWSTDDHASAMDAFIQSARRMVFKPYKTRALGVSSSALANIAKKAVAQAPFDQETARNFFEDCFDPFEIVRPGNNNDGYGGFVTAYYEPEVPASSFKTTEFSAPLYGRPDDLVDITDDNRPSGFNPNIHYAKLVEKFSVTNLQEYPDRQAIEAGCLAGKGLEIAWVKDKVEALFIHIQGSARLCFGDGSFARIGFAAKTGHAYTPVGKILLQRGELTKEQCGMQAIRDWFAKNPDQVDTVINKNRSFIFFKQYPAAGENEGPVGAAKVSLTSHRSLAVDRRLHTFGSPVWIETAEPLPGTKAPFAKLMVAQDTGSAIVGPARGDLFLGSGKEAGKIAGNVRHVARFVVLVPKECQ